MIALTAMALLVAWYVAAWVTVPAAIMRFGGPSHPALRAIEPAWMPMNQYCKMKWIGGQTLEEWRIHLQLRAIHGWKRSLIFQQPIRKNNSN